MVVSGDILVAIPKNKEDGVLLFLCLGLTFSSILFKPDVKNRTTKKKKTYFHT